MACLPVLEYVIGRLKSRGYDCGTLEALRAELSTRDADEVIVALFKLLDQLRKANGLDDEILLQYAIDEFELPPPSTSSE